MAEAAEAPAGVVESRPRLSWNPVWIALPLAAFLTANSAVWLQRNLLLYPPPWDQANYLTMSLRFWHAAQDGGLLGLGRALARSSAVWPPLFALTTAGFYALFGESRLVAHLTNGLYLLLLLVGIQSLTSAGHGRRAGALAAVLACGFSDVIRLSRDYLLDFPASALLAVAMAALVRSNELRRRNGAIAFGAAAGLAALTKTMTSVFFLAPLARALWRVRQQGDLKPALRHLALAALAASVIAAPWWLPHFGPALGYLFHYGVGAGAAPYATGGRTVLGLRNLTYYGWVLVNNAISFPSAVVIAALLGHRTWLRLRRKGAFAASWLDGVLWTWILAGYVVLTLVPNKGGDRYALFLLPPLAALYAGWLCSLARPWLRRAMVTLALMACAFNYAAQTWGFAALPRLVVVHPVVFLQQDYPQLAWMRAAIPLSAEVPWPVTDLAQEAADAVTERRGERARQELQALVQGPIHDPEAVLRLGYRTFLARDPDPGAAEHLEHLRSGRQTAEGFFATLARSDEFRRRPVRVLVVPDHPVVNAATLNYHAERARLRVAHAHLDEWPTRAESLDAFDAAVLKDGGWQGPDFTTRSRAPLEAALRAAGSGYRPAGSWPCPDGSRVVLMVRG